MTNNAAPAGHVLIVDDEKNIAKTFRFCLEDAGYRVRTAGGADEARAALQREVFDVCFLDLRLGDVSSLDLLPEFTSLSPWTRIVMVTAFASLESAVQAVRSGACDYLSKPCSPEQLRIAAAQQMDVRRMQSRIEALEQGGTGGTARPSEALKSRNPGMERVLEMVRNVADTDATVLIRGESGTGKGVVARAIHEASPRAGAQLVPVNCPSLSAELLESELFGHRKGAFTGATENTHGRVAQAEGGTLFLDEIGDFPLALQPKLLRFVQDREYERVGDATTRHADMRLVAATNRDLDAMVESGDFRQDLLFRLNVITIELPPLRERMEDVLDLASMFLARFAADYARPVRGFDEAAIAALRGYAWPGNVRELQNVVERAVILSRDDTVRVDALGIGASVAAAPGRPRAGDPIALDVLERAHIEAIVASEETLDEAARILGLNPSTLWRKRKSYAE